MHNCFSVLFLLMSLFVRMAGDLPTMEKAFFRNAIAAAFAIVILARTPEKFYIRKESWPDLIRRSLYGTFGVILNFWAIDHIAIADASVLNKMSPFFAIIMSAIILKEKATRKGEGDPQGMGDSGYRVLRSGAYNQADCRHCKSAVSCGTSVWLRRRRSVYICEKAREKRRARSGNNHGVLAVLVHRLSAFHAV